jgi:hypothetical protein
LFSPADSNREVLQRGKVDAGILGMSALGTSFIAFVVILGGAFVGTWLRSVLPEQHLADDTKDVVRLGTGLIGTISALVLGLLIASANSSYNDHSAHVQQIAAESSAGRDFVAIILQLMPQNEAQRTLKDRAIQAVGDLTQTRLLLFEQSGGSLPLPFLVVLVFWLAMIFASFGMFSRPNPTVIAALIVCVVSASGALFLVLELSEPFAGLMQISSAALRNALAPV